MEISRSFFIILVFLLMILPASSCRNSKPEQRSIPLTEDQLVDINRELVIKEKERIESYIRRKDLDMIMTDAGIWYSVIREGEGDLLKTDNKIRLEYSCSLLDGTLCYSSENSGDLFITIGKSDIASGLDEALRLFNTGSEAIVILPSNMAYGLVGDGDRIPARAALIYRIKVFPI